MGIDQASGGVVEKSGWQRPRADFAANGSAGVDHHVGEIESGGGEIMLGRLPILPLVDKDKAHRCFLFLRGGEHRHLAPAWGCLLYTSDAADDLTRVDLGGRRIIKK